MRKSEYTYDWEKFNETSLPECEDSHSHLKHGIYFSWWLHVRKISL